MLGKHNVRWNEVVEVLTGSPRVRRGRDSEGERRYQAIGRTDAGRRLRVIFRLEGEAAWVITAFDEGR
jgi:uncharacterized DUF497 family protein